MFIRIFDFSLHKVSGNTECNDYSGVVDRTGDKIKFSKFLATAMYGGNMATEREFLSKLTKVSYYKAAASQLKMYHLLDELLLVFEADN